MNKLLLVAAIVLCNALFATEEQENPTLKAEADKFNAVYKINEPIVFTAWALKKGKPVAGVQFDYELKGDGGLKEHGTAVSSIEGLKIRTKLNRPGFVLLSLRKEKPKGTYKGNYFKYIKAYAGAAVEPEKIKVSRPVPADFDQFWAKQKAELKAIPYTVERKLVKSTDKVNVYEIWLKGKDSKLNVSGQLVMPINAKIGTLPVNATFNGASSIGSAAHTGRARLNNAIVFNMSLHDIKPIVPRSEVSKYRKKIGGYQFKNCTNPDKYPMKDIFLRVLRSLEYLKNLPEWDGKNLIASGGSLGGCQAIVAAALDHDVTLCVAAAAAMCDHTGYLAKQRSGWPQLLKRHPEAIKISPYFDTANFATRIKCPVAMSVGFIDTICPPTATYAAYNNIPGKQKVMNHSITGGHSGLFTRPGDTGVYAFNSGYINRYIDVMRSGKQGKYDITAKIPIVRNGDFSVLKDTVINGEKAKFPKHWGRSGTGMIKTEKLEDGGNAISFDRGVIFIYVGQFKKGIKITLEAKGTGKIEGRFRSWIDKRNPETRKTEHVHDCTKKKSGYIQVTESYKTYTFDYNPEMSGERGYFYLSVRGQVILKNVHGSVLNTKTAIK
jgi:cephalosporin-C deacetylase-like acetyl esterase